MNKLMIGTWKSLEECSEKTFENFIEKCIQNGISDFDTALVYSKGKSETILGKFNEKITITTKIPGKEKPNTDKASKMEEAYDETWIRNCLEQSITRLRREPDTLLLHNWNYSWTGEEKAFEELLKIKEEGKCKSIGISLPNQFQGNLTEKVMKSIDWIMAPYNAENNWIKENESSLKKFNIKIICRSIFSGGKNVPKDKEDLKERINSIVTVANKIVVGTTNIEHVLELKEIMGE